MPQLPHVLKRIRLNFGDHIFGPGEYVSIRDDEGAMRTFQVVSVEPAA
jgi:hypothetical protein